MSEELSTWKEIAALMLARGEKVKVVAAHVNKSEQSIYNARSSDDDFKKLIQRHKDEIIEETQQRENQLISSLYDKTENALNTLDEIVTKREDLVCKGCGHIIDKCPECGKPVKVSVYDRDRVTAAKTVVENALKRKGEDDGTGDGLPRLVLNMAVKNG